MKIAIAGIGHVGLSNGALLAQHHDVVALDIIPEKVARLNHKKPSIQDVTFEDHLKNKPLNFSATLNKKDAYEEVNYVIIPPSMYYDPKTKYLEAISKLKSAKNSCKIGIW